MSIKSKKKRYRAKDEIRKITGHISFADILLSHRTAEEMTQVEMAETLGISKQDLCNIEKGRKAVSVERAMSFASALGKSTKVFAKYVLQDQLHKAGLKAEVEIKEVA